MAAAGENLSYIFHGKMKSMVKYFTENKVLPYFSSGSIVFVCIFTLIPVFFYHF